MGTNCKSTVIDVPAIGASERLVNDIIGRHHAHVPGTYDRHSHPDLWNN